MADAEHNTHVLLLPYPSQGHINPILQFSKRLAAHHGVRCTLAVTRFVLGQSRPSAGAVRVATISDCCDRGGFAEAGGVATHLDRLKSAGWETGDELLRSESEQGRPVHALVYDAFLPWAQRVARRHGVVACAAFFTQACAVDVAYAHAWAWRTELPLAGEEPVQLPELPDGLRRRDLPTIFVELDDCPAYLDLVVNQFEGLDTAEHILVNSFYKLQPQESEYMAYMWRVSVASRRASAARRGRCGEEGGD